MAVKVLHHSFERSTPLAYNGSKYIFKVCNHVQRVCATKQHIEVCMCATKMEMINCMTFHFKILNDLTHGHR